ncbi:MAG: hypothetical protein E7163_02890 [Firmicutes bacterium]|nr:hypothetical protein [Bacillota bacterium]
MFLLAKPLLCSELAEVWELVGWILWFFKIAIPILIIIFGMIDLGKSVVAAKPEEISKSAKSLAFRAVAGIFIFFVPTLVSMVFGVAPGFKGEEGISNDSEYKVCIACVTNPNGDFCQGKVSEAQNNN